ncbi:MAG: hypothetical protein ACI81L_001326 [Verrucomicrobiales bacterium]|jgi:uncharacterized protein (DUF1501 family)
MTNPLQRRRFLSLAGGTAGALALGACQWHEQVAESVSSSTTTPTSTSTSIVSDASVTPRPLLVVVNLGGGNDAINTVVPMSGRYHDLRPAIGIDDGDLLPVGDGHGMHPSLSPLLPYWDSGRLAIAQGVGIAGQSRSHFAATDTLFAGQAGYISTGWLGRWLDDHPQAGADPLLAVALGGGRSAVAGETASATIITRPEQFLLRTAPGMNATALSEVLLATAAPGTESTSSALDLVRAGVPKAMHAIDILEQIGSNESNVSLEPTSATTLLSVAAQIVQLNLSTEVVLVDLGGFDTHANQTATHASLLADVATGIANLLASIQESTSRDALVITTSEFGRRAEDNGSGTDHGAAGGSLLLGSSVRGGTIVGSLGLDRLVDGDLPIEVDTRSIYANAIDHLNGDASGVLGGEYDRLSLR